MNPESGEDLLWMTGEVAFPQAVLDALAEGRLVFFVGAGASVDGPSSLPLFDDLARQLAEMARVPFDKGAAIDFFLGSMPTNFDVRAHARDIIARENSQPNSTHAALVRIAEAGDPLRIVTTNFDDHLAAAAASEGIAIPDKWIGPALPMGDNFAGLVHLHGSVLRDARELVLTDGDFGRAYLTQAWATRFLLPMFQKFTVLFIGYSHDDPIMRYLSLGLPSATPRYALTDIKNAEDPKWARLGVTTISYPVKDGNHGALVAALEAWSSRARMGQLEHRVRMREIVDAGPALTPVDRDYLIGRLETVDGCREFAEAAESIAPVLRVEWLRWIETLPVFQGLFSGREQSDAASILGNWFSQGFIGDPALHGAALQTVQRLGQAFSDGLFRAAGWTADELSKRDAGAGQRWKTLLATSVYGHSAPVATATLLAYLPGDSSEHFAVLRAALRPHLVLKPRWLLGDTDDMTALPDAEVRWITDADSLTKHVLKAVEDAEPGDLVLGGILEDSLNAAYDLLNAYHGDRGRDGLSFGRSAIEMHEQDQFRDPIDAVIDGLRAYSEKARPGLPDLSERWWSMGRSLFQRLALHLLAADTLRTADDKILWLLDRSTLYEADLKHEVYRILDVATGASSDEVRMQLLEAAHEGPTFTNDVPDRDRHAAYATYNLLVWLTHGAPQWAEAAAALDAIQAANPTFAPRENPDFDHWMTSGTWSGKLPMEPEDFIRIFEERPDRALRTLLSRDYSERTFDEPDWSDALNLVSRVSESRPDVGEHLWELIDEGTDADAREDDLRRAIIDGWAKADLGDTANAATARVGTQTTNQESARAVSRFLLEQVRAQIDSDETPTLAAMRQIASTLWREQRETFTHLEGASPVSFAPLYLNSWPGDLAQYWMNEIDRRWRKHRDDWSGLNHQERGALIELLEGPPHTLDATRPALATALFFMFAADSDFTTEHILPLFREDATATLAWKPYLHHPRYNDKLLEAGLLDSVLGEWARLDALGDPGLQSRFFGIVASVVSFGSIDPGVRQSLLDQSVLADDGAHAAAFAETVVRLLNDDGVDGAEIWNQWLRDHVSARLAGLPRIAQPEELARWADVVPHLGAGIQEALGLLNGRGIGLGERFFDPEFPEGVLAAHGVALVEHYAERVRSSSPTGYLVPHQVRDLIDAIRAAIGDISVKPLVDAARERGFLGNRTS